MAELPQPSSHPLVNFSMDADFDGMRIENVRISNAHVGLGVGPGGRVRSRGLQIDNCDIGIDNSGSFDGPDTIIR